MTGEPIVSARFGYESIEVSPDGDALVIEDEALITAIKALRDNCVVTITVAAKTEAKQPPAARTLGDSVNVNLGCKGS